MSRALPTKLCAHCGKEFARDNRCTWAHWQRAKFCSRKCAGGAWSLIAAEQRPDMRTKFNSHVVQRGDCWEWTWLKDKNGYGLFPYAGKQYRAPVLALEFDGRPVPKGMYACHTCDNPACVKPLHLYPGTPAQNMADAKQRNRLRPKTKLTPDQVRAIRSADGTNKALGERYGVSHSLISMIKTGRVWGNLS